MLRSAGRTRRIRTPPARKGENRDVFPRRRIYIHGTRAASSDSTLPDAGYAAEDCGRDFLLREVRA